MAVIFFALFLRIYKLDNRPLHVDEAVHAVKFGELLEKGDYKYDPVEYHGPTLNYFTFVFSTLFNDNSFKDIDEYTIRLVPAITAVFFILIFALFFRQSEFYLNLIIVLLLSISAVFVFYSRYYIQEVLLVSYTYIFLLLIFKYFKKKKRSFIIYAGIFAGLIFSTKETSIIVFSAIILSFILLRFSDTNLKETLSFSLKNFAVLILFALIISFLFYSSFFSNYEGIIDSLKTFSNYFTKASANAEHSHPWYYYIELLGYTNNEKIFYTDILLIICAFVGGYFVFTESRKRDEFLFFRFISIYSFFQFFIYSLISYKTPWLVLNFWIGFLIMSGLGIHQTYLLLKNRIVKRLFLSLISLVLIFSIWQTYEINFKYPFQPENPFTYSQATTDIIRISERIKSVAEATNEKENILIDVIAPKSDYWPLPWYLRKFNNVAWNNKVEDSVYKFPIIISVPDLEKEITEKLYSIPPAGKKNLYVPLNTEYTELRPGVELRGYVQKDIMDKYLRTIEESE